MTAIERHRKKMKLSQEKLAERLGITQGAVSQWEKGESKPRTELLPKIAKILNCSIDELFKEIS